MTSTLDPAVSADPVDRALVRRTEDLLPLLRANAAEAERLRRLPAANVEALQGIGATRLTMPARFGGLQANLPTQFEVIRTIARGCGSSSWVAALYTVCGWWASLFPDQVQEEVFSSPDVRVAGIVSPLGTLVPAEGGFVLNGTWAWNTGVLDAQWDVVATLRPHDDGSMEPYLVIVPTSDMEVQDDWFMSGMQGTGSNSSVARDVFVPAERAMPFPPLLGGNHASVANRDVLEYSYAVFPFLLSNSFGTPIGMAQGALESFLERAPKRRISFEDVGLQSTSPVAQLQVAEISMKIDAALAIARQAASSLHRQAAEGTPVGTGERVRTRAAVAYTTRLSAEVTTDLARIGGASAFGLDVAGQRFHRDATMLGNHAYLNYEANLGLLGSTLMGHEPQSLFL